MNSDNILKLLNRLANSRSLSGSQRSVIQQAMQHIKLQDQGLDKIREDVSHWRNPDDDAPPEEA
jgi:hypothetical protein